MGNKGVQSLLKSGIGRTANVAEGKALEYAVGVTPVFVVNWPANMTGNVPAGMKEKTKDTFDKSINTAVDATMAGMFLRGAGFMLPRLGLLGAAGVGSYMITSELNDLLRNPAGKLGELFYDFSRASWPEVKNNINIHVDKEGRAFIETDNMNSHVKVQTNRGNFLGR